MIELEKKDHRLKSRNVTALRAGTRGLFSVLLEQRELVIKMTDNDGGDTDGNHTMNEDCIDDTS